MGNYSYTGLGCDRTTGPWGTGYAGDYAPANTAMFNSVETYANTVFWSHL
jgi:alpha-glucuronidase